MRILLSAIFMYAIKLFFSLCAYIYFCHCFALFCSLKVIKIVFSHNSYVFIIYLFISYFFVLPNPHHIFLAMKIYSWAIFKSLFM